MPNKRTKSHPQLIGTFFTDDGASVVLGSYKSIVLNKFWMCMDMAGPGDRERLLETCRTIVIENNTNSDTRGDTVSQIYRTFLHSNITYVSVMQPTALDHYVVMESDELHHLKAVFEEMDSEDTVVMIRTRTPYNRGGITFKFRAAKIT